MVCMACNTIEKQCHSELAKVSDAIKQGKLDIAQQAFTPELKSRCAEVPRTTIVRVELNAARQKANRDRANKSAAEANRVAMQGFLKWVAQHVDAPHELDDNKECYEPGDPETGFCESAVVLNNQMRSVAWRKDDPKAFEFESEPFRAGPEVTCEDFDATKVRRWRWQGAGILSHCVLGADIDPRLSQLHLWIKNADDKMKYLRVFSDAYLEVAPYNFASTLKTQGTTL